MIGWKKIKGINARVHPAGKVEYISIRLGGYEVSNVEKKPQVYPNGRLFYRFGGRRLSAHLLVAQYFIPNPKRYKYVEHRDGDYSNNRKSNLKWVPHRSGTYEKPIPGNAVLTQKKADRIRKEILTGKSLTAIADKWDISVSLVSLIKSGKRWT